MEQQVAAGVDATQRQRVPFLAGPLAFAVMLATAECAWSGAALALQLQVPAWLAGHAVIMATAVATFFALRHRIDDAGVYVLALLPALVAGPAGALLAFIALMFNARQRTHPELLEAWYARISLAGDTDAATDLYNTVAMGRALTATVDPPPAFERVMAEGTLVERQNALGLISRQFSPSYAGALRQALISPEPVIRVQAAAVAVKVRTDLTARLARLAARAHDPGLSAREAAGLAVEVDAIARSGLVEESDQSVASATRDHLLALAISALRSGDDAGLDAGEELRIVETELLRRGDFAAFRAVRARAASGGPEGGPHV